MHVFLHYVFADYKGEIRYFAVRKLRSRLVMELWGHMCHLTGHLGESIIAERVLAKHSLTQVSRRRGGILPSNWFIIFKDA